jgi:hypothetical protein
MTHLQLEVWQAVDQVSKAFRTYFWTIHNYTSSLFSCVACFYNLPFIILGVFDNTLDRTEREQRKISAPPTMETPDRRTSFIKSNSTMHGLRNNVNDNQIQEMPTRNDNEGTQNLPSIIPEQDEPMLGEFVSLLKYGVTI